MARKKRGSINEFDEESGGVSRSAVKRELKERQQQVAHWPDLPLTQLKNLPLAEDLIDQLLQARELKADSGRRRLLRFVAKRLDDEDFANVENHLADSQQVSLAAVQREKACEQWREKMLAGDEALTAFFADYSHAEHQILRQTVRQARTEVERNKDGQAVPPVAQRKLFKMLRDTIASAETD